MNRVTGAEIVAYARTLKGTPYHHQGRLPSSLGVKGGIDCIGVGVLIARHFGWPHADKTDYDRHPDGKLEDYLRAQMDEIAIAHADEGDLFCMWFNHKPGSTFRGAIAPHGVPEHTALRTDYGILHAQWIGRRAPNQVSEHVFSAQWRDRVMSAFRFRQA